ncbi:MAG: response regulator transcription factor [Bacteroidia bacterium]|jgi:two-component system alkaline phosphatase synthesis response regulator PhoP|nr:response regulator transcription factor [Bacteroidia bacterium]
MKRRILLAEDEEHLLKTIRLNLEMEGYDVLAVIDGSSAVRAFEPGGFDLVILDVMLPLMNGFEICQAIRKQDTAVPVLFLTAKAAGEDKVQGLRIGADDYLTKPFNLEEFLLRVQNLLKRSTRRAHEPQLSPQFTFGRNRIDFATFEATGNGKTWPLTKREAELLRLLIDKKGEVVSRDLILESLWNDDALPTARTIDNYILNYRKYFEENPRNPRHFHSVRGVGYKFTE